MKSEIFFKPTKQINIDDSISSSGDQALKSDVFYERCMTNACREEKCVSEKLAEQKKINELLEKCEKTKEAIKSVNSIIKEKNNKIEALRKLLETSTIQRPKKTKSAAIIAKVTPVCQTTSMPDAVIVTKEGAKHIQSQLSFSKFLGHFNELQLAQLRSLGPTVRDDSSFVFSAMRFLYSDRLDCLKSKSVSGRGRTKVEKKEKLTPEKKTIIEEMFVERISRISVNKEENISRNKLLHKYVKDAIYNISRSELSKNSQRDACQNLAKHFE